MSIDQRPILKVDGQIIKDGLRILVAGRKFDIKYPLAIWSNLSQNLKDLLLENLVFIETHFLPLMLDKEKIQYNFNYPLLEPGLFKNQLFDMLDCEREDKAPHLSYFRKFYNLEFGFKSPNSTWPSTSKISMFKRSQPTAVIPFSFGKESLVTFALCRELGIKPILVYCQEPVQPYEEKYKVPKLKKLAREFKTKTYFIEHGPGLFRYGRAFNKKTETEIGWGTQTTLLALLSLPFVYYHQANYLFFGDEYLNNNVRMVKDWKVFFSADQTTSMVMMKNNLIKLLTNNQCQLKSTLEPLEEISIFYLLYHRYPQVAKYQFSCMAEKPLYAGTQWCHQCWKCRAMFLYALFVGIDPAIVGFKKDLINETPELFDFYFNSNNLEFSEEWDFIFLGLYRKGLLGKCLPKFKKNKLPSLKPWKFYCDFFFRLKPAINAPAVYQTQMMAIFKKEMSQFKQAVLDNKR